jgi:hypothetical protein
MVIIEKENRNSSEITALRGGLFFLLFFKKTQKGDLKMKVRTGSDETYELVVRIGEEDCLIETEGGSRFETEKGSE